MLYYVYGVNEDHPGKSKYEKLSLSDIRQKNQEEQTMLKKSVLTPVLSGVLAVSVAGSGFAYYNTYVKDGKGSDKNASDGEKTVKSMLTVDEAAKVLETRIDKAQEVAKGNLDNGAKAVITYSAPQSGSIGELGLKDVTIGVEAKQKDKMSGMDYTFGYDGKNVLTMNMVYDNDSQTAYVKIPELSDAYLVGTAEDMESMSQNMSGMGGITSMQPDTSAFDDYDFDALIDDLTGYLDTIKENAPEAKDGGKYTVEKDGVKIDLDTKTYHITASLSCSLHRATFAISALDGSAAGKCTRQFDTPVESISRIVFRTGPLFTEPNSNTPADQLFDQPLADNADSMASFALANVHSSVWGDGIATTVLRYDDFAHYAEHFNAMEDENIVTTIPNAQASEWMKENIPLFDCPDEQMREMYYYRWWTLRKHIKRTPVGYGMTEFLVQRSYADKYNLIACAIGHHIMESRWLRDTTYLHQILRTWYFGNNGQAMAKMNMFSSWNPYAVLDMWKVQGDTAFLFS